MKATVTGVLLLSLTLGFVACGDDDGSGESTPTESTDATDSTDTTNTTDSTDATDVTDATDTPPACTQKSDCDQGGLPACRERLCDTATGKCTVSLLANGTPCSSGNACSEDESCQSGLCAAGTAVTCEDGDPCTQDNCDLTDGCQFTKIPGCPCVPSCEEKTCGGDGCNGSCGDCAAEELCADGDCQPLECQPACDGAECGDDGCGGSCGACAGGVSCVEGQCTEEVCVPDCADKACGSNGCGGTCGDCPDAELCNAAGICEPAPCIPDCTGKVCGSDGCEGECGACPTGQTCNAAQVCEELPCEANCEGKSCGDDGCGGSCGDCTAPEICTVTQVCVEPTCEPNCEGKSCGDDGCGGLCGTCGAGDACNEPVCQAGVCEVKPTTAVCDDGDACTSKDVCGDGICAGEKTVDPFEPNDAFIGSTLGEFTDCDGAWTTFAVIDPVGDEDWFWYFVTDEVLCDVQPRIQVTPSAGANVDLCAFFSCEEGNVPKVTCLLGEPADGPVAGAKGCCSKKPGDAIDVVRFNVDCGAFTNENGYVDIQVFAPEPSPACGAYALTYGDS